MSLEKGDSQNSEMILTRTFPSDSNGSAGDLVEFDGSDRVSPTDAADDDLVGVLAEDSPSSAGEDVAVVVFGPVIVNSASGVAAGDVVEPSATAGQVAVNAEGRRRAVDEGATNTYNLAQGNPWCLTKAGGTLDDGTSLGSNEAEIFMK